VTVERVGDLQKPSTLDEILKAEGYDDAVAVMAVKSPAMAEATVHKNHPAPQTSPLTV
jgi:hypothetical protein